MRIGIYGGTFNPIHRGHLTAAAAAAKQLCLDKLLLVPDAIPPHKPLPAGSADAADRLEMVQLCTGELPVPAEVTDLELRRQGASYSCDTLAALREQYPADELFFLMGSDMFLSFETWRRPEEICRLATLAVFSRRTADEAAAFARQKKKLEKAFSARVTVVMNPEVIEVSSTQLREELARGRGRAYLTEPVYGYILRKGLYGTATDLKHLTPEELRPIALSYLKPKRMPHVLGT
ncbi:MAG TPA: nicotinate (nicotinamide) nucleotide adenylyltransferase, partial [Oscillibacter sp.]|nr:nicotinate (nicotinamide) nucleotide adenylyltransferase [Oscillibacter sp.]